MAKKNVIAPTRSPNGPHTPQTKAVSSPAATGGAGTFFEQHVAAYWLAQLLVQAIPPILHDCSVNEVHLQTEHLGWHTDDFLIVGQNGIGNQRKLAGQVKRSFTVSATDDECNKAIKDFWQDFTNSRQFSPTTDRFALIVLRGTNVLLGHFSGLLDCARVAPDAAEFERRLAKKGFISAKSISYCSEIQTIIGEVEGKNVSVSDIWAFLRVLHILSLDLNTTTRQTEVMIRSLLAHTTSEPDAFRAAENSWNELLREVGDGMPTARSFRRTDLPDVLRQHHSPVGGAEQRALRALDEHSALIQSGIRSTIGNELHLVRDQLVQQVIEQIGLNHVVLVTGPAGSGKSGVAKAALEALTADHFVFSFRAEEFAYPHFDGTLQSAQIPVNSATLGAVLAAQTRKVVLVESMERLLEKSTRDAFVDLLTLLAKDNGWRLVLTCRDYSADLVRTCFLASAGLGHSVVLVPPLDDEELAEVEAAYPVLARPFAHNTLRVILRNPYILDKALRIRWSEERPLPQSEREFRDLCWREIIRVDHQPADGMPRRREEAFVQIALRRARTLDLYAPCSDLSPEVIDGLRRDSLIVSSQQSSVLLAPAHDVLEDWAILRWVEEQYALSSGSIESFATTVGTHPALRRTYRKWVIELVEQDQATADDVFRTVLHDGDIPAHFRDDTLISLLRSPLSETFLERHDADLFSEGKRLIRRVIHLLRIACMTTPAWLPRVVSHASTWSIPDGPAWGCVLRLVHNHIQSFATTDRGLLLGFIEDWARGVSWQIPYPIGAESAVAIAYWLLAQFNDYQAGDQRKRTLQVIAKIPNADRQRFSLLLRGDHESAERNRTVEDFQDLIFEGVEGAAAARDLPDLVVSTATEWLLASEEDLKRDWRFGGHQEIESLFGIKDRRNHGFFPASAYRGPFLQLLRHHPNHGLAFIIDVFHHSADWYAHPRIRFEYVESPFEITLHFSEGVSRNQWCNARLWNLYRGTSVGPYVLQCMLMALERWLLEFAEAYPKGLEKVLLRILRESDSSALTAVVASTAIAFPQAAGETLLVLLRSPTCILLDRTRMATEHHALSGFSGLLSLSNAMNRVFEDERRQADSRPHRNYDLETAILQIQFGPLAPRVHEILDRHIAELPKPDAQSERDHIWRLALHRMDLRQYNIAPHIGNLSGDSEDVDAEAKKTYVQFTPKELSPDLKEMTIQATERHQTMNANLGVMMWGIKVFSCEEPEKYDPVKWRIVLQESRLAAVGNVPTDETELSRSGPGTVAAVCVRDHWEELSIEEQRWCIDIVCSEVEREGNNWNHLARAQRNSMSADRPCARVLSLLIGRTLDDSDMSRVQQAFVIALTHAIDEVRWYAVFGIGNYLWTIDRELVMRCLNAIAMEATLVQETYDNENRKASRVPGFGTNRRDLDEIEAEAANSIRNCFYTPNSIPSSALQESDLSRWFGAEAHARILSILGQAANEELAIVEFQRIAHTLVSWWNEDDNRNQHRERNYETESSMTDLLENFVLRTLAHEAQKIMAPIVEAIDRHPDKIHWIVQGLIGVEDRISNTQQFWTIWEQLADGVRRATWISRIDDRHAYGRELITSLFLNTWWKEDIHHWRSLEGHADHVHRLFNELPATALVMDAYLRFLYHIGDQSLPSAFMQIANRLQAGNPSEMLREGNSVFMLEVLLQRFVYGKPLELKRGRTLRESVLLLLDLLIENGSSAAFRMRDDFVTPVSNTAYVY